MGKLIDFQEKKEARQRPEPGSKRERRGKPVVELDSRRSFIEKQGIRKRINRATIREEMEQNGKTTVFEGSHRVTLTGMSRSLQEIERVLLALTDRERTKLEQLAKDIALDVHVRDWNFTCTVISLGNNQDPEVSALYKKLRATVFLNIGVMLPEIPNDVA